LVAATFPDRPLPSKKYTVRTSKHDLEVEEIDKVLTMHLGGTNNSYSARLRPRAEKRSAPATHPELPPWDDMLPHKTAEVYFPLPHPGSSSQPLDPDMEPRPYVPTLFHSLHCLDMIRISLFAPLSVEHVYQKRDDTDFQMEHDEHCFNYLRQLFLCQADTTLEEVTEPMSDLPVADGGYDWRVQYGSDGERTCRDWRVVWDSVVANREEWELYQRGK
jgi:hypothetical protein